jgi:hypothetical protein
MSSKVVKRASEKGMVSSPPVAQTAKGGKQASPATARNATGRSSFRRWIRVI